MQDLEAVSQKLKNYKPSSQAIAVIRSTPLVLLVGISGAGKDSIKHRLLASGQYYHIVSHTTRPPRYNQGVLEQEGVEYHFIDLKAAAKMIRDGAYVEAKRYGNNIYGTSVAEIQVAHDSHRIAMTDMEVQGVAEYKAINPEVRAIFILPPSFDEWQARLRRRYGEEGADPEDMRLRMQTAQAELEHALQAGYFEFVINDDLDAAVQEIDAIAHGKAVTQNNAAAQRLSKELMQRLAS